MWRHSVLILALLLSAGCFQVYERDPATVVELRRTIENREADHRYLMGQLPEGATVTATLRLEVQTLHDSEMDRLKAWGWREEKKHGTR